MGLYGFLATLLRRPAWKADKYQRRHWTMRAWGVGWSGMLSQQNEQLMIISFALEGHVLWMAVSDARWKVVGVGEEIGEHLEKRSPLKDKCRKNYLRKIHAGSHLRQQVRDDGTVLIQRVDCNDHMTYELGAAYAINKQRQSGLTFFLRCVIVQIYN